jgi:fructose-1-phosphate kinase PfkB-like protein
MNLKPLDDRIVVKPNEAELSALYGRELLTFEEITGAAREIARSGIPVVVVSLGRAGGIITDGKKVWQASPPEIEFVSAVGSGDAMVAAILDAFSRGGDLPEALRAGIAAGAANATTYGAGFVNKQEVARLMEDVAITELE